MPQRSAQCRPWEDPTTASPHRRRLQHHILSTRLVVGQATRINKNAVSGGEIYQIWRMQVHCIPSPTETLISTSITRSLLGVSTLLSILKTRFCHETRFARAISSRWSFEYSSGPVVTLRAEPTLYIHPMLRFWVYIIQVEKTGLTWCILGGKGRLGNSQAAA